MGQVFLMGGSGGIDVEVADATTEQVLNGVKFYSNENEGDEILVGIMPNNGKVEKTLNAGGKYTIPVGYHNGEGYVKATDLASQTSATATSGVIQSGYTAWVDGNKVTGTYSKPTQRSASNKSLGYSESVTYYSGYYPSTWSVTAPAAGGVTRGARGSFSFSGGEIPTDSSRNYGDFSCSINFGFTPTYVFIQFPDINANTSVFHNTRMCVCNINSTYCAESSGLQAQLINVSSSGCTLRIWGWKENKVIATSGTAYYVAV